MTQTAPRSGGTPGSRPAIAASWLRARVAGVDQHDGRESLGDSLVAHEIAPRSPLVEGAAPVLAQLEAGLAGTGHATLLGDRECRIVRRWFDDARTHEDLDALGIREGVSLLEDEVGTNGLGTVIETRTPVAVHGDEHWAEPLRRFSCYGHPIRHPVTGRIEGVLNVASAVHAGNPLLAPLVARAAHDIEQRLLGSSRVSEQLLLAAFREASGRRAQAAQAAQAVVAVGDDIVLSNQAAADLLTPADLARLRVLAEDPPARGEAAVTLGTGTGRSLVVRVSRVAGADRGVLLRVEQRATGRHLTPAGLVPAAAAPAPAPTLVAGPPGSGRSTRAREIAALPVQVLRAAAALLEGPAAWASDFAAAMARTEGTVVVDGVDLLPDELVDLVAEGVGRRRRPDVVLTSGPVDTLTGRAAALAATALHREELTSLASRSADVPDLAAAVLRAVAPGRSVHLTPAVLQALTAHPWPGNLRELEAVIAHAAARRSCGGIVLADLPADHQAGGSARPLTALDRAERDAILVALREAAGNKVRAARHLGVSRTTLYARMRQLRITTY